MSDRELPERTLCPQEMTDEPSVFVAATGVHLEAFLASEDEHGQTPLASLTIPADPCELASVNQLRDLLSGTPDVLDGADGFEACRGPSRARIELILAAARAALTQPRQHWPELLRSSWSQATPSPATPVGDCVAQFRSEALTLMGADADIVAAVGPRLRASRNLESWEAELLLPPWVGHVADVISVLRGGAHALRSRTDADGDTCLEDVIGRSMCDLLTLSLNWRELYARRMWVVSRPVLSAAARSVVILSRPRDGGRLAAEDVRFASEPIKVARWLLLQHHEPGTEFAWVSEGGQVLLRVTRAGAEQETFAVHWSNEDLRRLAPTYSPETTECVRTFLQLGPAQQVVLGVIGEVLKDRHLLAGLGLTGSLRPLRRLLGTLLLDDDTPLNAITFARWVTGDDVEVCELTQPGPALTAARERLEWVRELAEGWQGSLPELLDLRNLVMSGA